MSLVIVESPAKCKKIQGFLGDGWTVIASMGHIRALESELDAIGLDRDFDARFTFQKEKAKAIQQIKASAKGMKEIYLAADDDREGEAIAYSVAVLLDLDPKKAKRSVFHEITKAAVLKAVKEPRLLDMNKVDAQQARSILDMMVGFTISPLLWTYVGNALSAGRCQTPALRLVVEKEKQIQSFTSETSWKLSGTWLKGSTQMAATLVDDLEDEESARNFLENIHNDAGGSITSTQTKPWSLSAPKPLITSTLQQEGSARFSCNPKKTMMIAQRLYEAGHITYMRTDHAILSGEAIVSAKELLRKEFGDAYVQSDEVTPGKKTGNSEVKAQEAHEAIRPTHFETVDLPTTEDWSAVDRRIYKLIRDRALQSVMTHCKGEEHTIVLLADGDPSEFPWVTKWKRTTFLGWKRIGVSESNLDGDEEESKENDEATWARAIAIKVGDKVKWTSLEAFPIVTKAPGRFNEATLVRELEKKGIGRPSTFAMLISTILDKEYVKKENYPAREIKIKHLLLSAVGQLVPTEVEQIKKVGAEKDKLTPTDLGVRILEFCLREFSGLFDYAFTSRMEARLDSIAEGKEPWKQLCRDTWSSYKDTVDRLKKNGAGADAKNSRVKEFPGGLKAVLSKKGPILLKEDESGDKEKTQFYGWIEGLKFEDMTEEAATALVEKKALGTEAAWGEFEGEAVLLKSGPFGKYYQCGTIRIPAQEDDTVESVQGRLTAKKNSVLHSLGDFEFRTGQYGVFMFKKTTAKGKKPAFVGLPEGLDPKSLTEEAAIRIYQTGLQQKARSKAIGSETKEGDTGTTSFRGRGRGGFRGRGRGGFRGRGT